MIRSTEIKIIFETLIFNLGELEHNFEILEFIEINLNLN